MKKAKRVEAVAAATAYVYSCYKRKTAQKKKIELRPATKEKQAKRKKQSCGLYARPLTD